MASDYENLDYLDRATEILIEHQVTAHARAYGATRVDEVVSHLSEHGLGDVAVSARVARAANRLVGQGILVRKGDDYHLSERGHLKAEQASNLLMQLSGLPVDGETLGMTEKGEIGQAL